MIMVVVVVIRLVVIGSCGCNNVLLMKVALVVGL